MDNSCSNELYYMLLAQKLMEHYKLEFVACEKGPFFKTRIYALSQRVSFLSFLTFTRTNTKTFIDAFIKICLAENGSIFYQIVFCKVNFKHKITNFLILHDATILVCSLELCLSESNYKKGKIDKIS